MTIELTDKSSCIKEWSIVRTDEKKVIPQRGKEKIEAKLR